MVPIGRLVTWNEIFVGDNICLCQALRNLQSAAKLANVGDHLMGHSIAPVCRQYRNTPACQGGSQCLCIADNLRHIDPAIRDHFSCRNGQGGYAVDLVRRGQNRENSMSERLCQLWIIPDHDAALGAAKGFPRGPGQHCCTFTQGVLKLTTGNQSQLMCAIKKDRAAPLRNNVMDCLERKWKERHRSAQCHKFRTYQRRYLAKKVKINFEFNRIKGNVYNLQATYSCRSIVTVAGMSAQD